MDGTRDRAARPCHRPRRPNPRRLHPRSPTRVLRVPRSPLLPSPLPMNTALGSYPVVACSLRVAVAPPSFVSSPTEASADWSIFHAASVPYRGLRMVG